MRQLNSLLTRFITNFEEAQYYDSTMFNPTLYLSRFYTPIPNSKKRLLNIKVKLIDEASNEGSVFVIYTDLKSMKTYWNNYGPDYVSDKDVYFSLQGPFDDYLQAAVNLEAYLLVDFDYVQWDMSYEIPLIYG